MRDFRVIAFAYKKGSKETDAFIRKAVASLVNKVKSAEETVMHFGGDFDEKQIREQLKKVRTVLEEKEQNLGVIVFESLKYNPSAPAEYDGLFDEIYTLARAFDITIIVLLRCPKSYYALSLRDFQEEYGTDGGIERFINLLISAEPLHPNQYVANVLKNRCGDIGNHLIK